MNCAIVRIHATGLMSSFSYFKKETFQNRLQTASFYFIVRSTRWNSSGVFIRLVSYRIVNIMRALSLCVCSNKSTKAAEQSAISLTLQKIRRAACMSWLISLRNVYSFQEKIRKTTTVRSTLSVQLAALQFDNWRSAASSAVETERACRRAS